MKIFKNNDKNLMLKAFVPKYFSCQRVLKNEKEKQK